MEKETYHEGWRDDPEPVKETSGNNLITDRRLKVEEMNKRNMMDKDICEICGIYRVLHRKIRHEFKFKRFLDLDRRDYVKDVIEDERRRMQNG